MSRIPKLRRPNVQPATVIATLALFISLGGTSYAVTGGTPFSWINGAQLQAHTVTGDKLAQHTVTGGDVDIAGFPMVPTARTALQANRATSANRAATITGNISGAQVSSPVASAVSAESAQNAVSAQSAQSAVNSQTAQNAVNAQNAQTAQSAQNAQTAVSAKTITGTVNASQIAGAVATATNAANATSAATAANATNAATATNATNATNATYVDGDKFANISVSSGSATDVSLGHDLAGLSLALRCSGGTVFIDATTSVSGASYGISAVANNVATSFAKAEGNFNTGATITSTLTAPSQLTFSYEAAGDVASGTITAYDASGTCSAFGVAEYS